MASVQGMEECTTREQASEPTRAAPHAHQDHPPPPPEPQFARTAMWLPAAEPRLSSATVSAWTDG